MCAVSGGPQLPAHVTAVPDSFAVSDGMRARYRAEATMPMHESRPLQPYEVGADGVAEGGGFALAPASSWNRPAATAGRLRRWGSADVFAWRCREAGGPEPFDWRARRPTRILCSETRDGRNEEPRVRPVPIVVGVAVLLAGCGSDTPVATGEAPEPLVQAWNDWAPKWSPDGSRIAIRSNRATRHEPPDTEDVLYFSHNDVFLLDEGGNAVQVTDGLGDLPPWSNDGLDATSHDWAPDGRIAFSSGRSLWIVEADGSGLREALDHGYLLGNVAWSPTGGSIAFSWTPGCSSAGCAPSRISVFGVDTGAVTLLTDPDVSSYDPSWSPDGSELVYWSRPSPGEVRLTRMRNDGTEVTPLAVTNGADVAWSPCGDAIAFSRTTAPGEFRILLADPDGSNVRQLTFGEQPSWSPDCAELAFIRGDLELGLDIWIIDADGTGERKLTNRTPRSG